MARHLSWIDNDKLSNLFNRVGSSRGRAPARAPAPVPMSPRPAAPSPTAAARAPAPVAPVPPALVVPASVPPAPIAQAYVPPAPAMQVPVVPPAPQYAAAPALPEPAPFTPSVGAELYTRMSEFLDWVMDAMSLHGVVLADSDGLVIAQRNGSELEAAMTVGFGPMMQTAADILFENPSDKLDFHGHVTFEHHGRQLISLWAPTSQGTCYGVLIGDTVPASSVLKLVERGLRTVFAD